MRISDCSSDVCSSDLEIARGVRLIEDLQRGDRRAAQHPDEREGPALALVPLDRLGVGEEHRSLMEGDALRAVEEFCGAEHERIGLVVEGVARLGRASCRERECHYV